MDCFATFNLFGLEVAENELIANFFLPLKARDLFTQAIAPYQSILFYGPRGNGKSSLLKALGKKAVNSKYYTKFSTDCDLNTTIMKARTISPSLILLDGLEYIFPAAASSPEENAEKIKFLFQLEDIERMGEHVLIVACCGNRNDVDHTIISNFQREVKIGYLDQDARSQLIKHLLSSNPTIRNMLNDVDIGRIVDSTKRQSASEIRKLVKDAMLMPIIEAARKSPDIFPHTALRPVTYFDFVKPPTIISTDASVASASNTASEAAGGSMDASMEEGIEE